MGVIFLIRHGETEWNKEEIFRGTVDVPLNSTGTEQARRICQALCDRGIELVLSSPLRRAVETARPLAERLRIPVTVVNQFADMNYGEWQTLSRSEVEERYPELYSRWAKTPHEVAFPGGDRVVDVFWRAWRAFRRIALENRDKKIAVVSHRVITKLILCGVLGIGPEGFWRIRQDTGCINEIDLEGDEFTVIRLNDTSHLKEIGRYKLDF